MLVSAGYIEQTLALSLDCAVVCPRIIYRTLPCVYAMQLQAPICLFARVSFCSDFVNRKNTNSHIYNSVLFCFVSLILNLIIGSEFPRHSIVTFTHHLTVNISFVSFLLLLLLFVVFQLHCLAFYFRLLQICNTCLVFVV